MAQAAQHARAAAVLSRATVRAEGLFDVLRYLDGALARI